MIFRNPEKTDKASDSADKGSGFLKIIAILGFISILIFILAAILLISIAPGWDNTSYKSAPSAEMIVSEGEGGVWTVQIVKINPQASIISVHWYLLDVQGNTKTDGLVSDVYGYEQGEGKAVRFIDKDFNGKLSPGDKFKFHPSEPNSDLEDTDDFYGFSFRLKFEPTGDVLLSNDLLFE